MSEVVRAPGPWSARTRVGWAAVALAAIATTLYFVPPYATFRASASRIILNPSYPSNIVWLGLHAIPAGLVLLLGPFQFVPAIRHTHPRLHRITGRTYLVSLGVAAVMGLLSAGVSRSGFAVQVAFLLLVAGWVFTASMGFRAVRRRQYGLHRVWMIRNYSLTFAAVMLRVFLIAGTLLTVGHPSINHSQVYTASAWAGLLVSLVFAEWFILQRTVGPLVQPVDPPPLPRPSAVDAATTPVAPS